MISQTLYADLRILFCPEQFRAAAGAIPTATLPPQNSSRAGRGRNHTFAALFLAERDLLRSWDRLNRETLRDMSSCPTQIKLMEEVRQTLSHLAELMQREREAVSSGSDEEMMAIDKEIEHGLGTKERQMGALRQHRREHGC